MLITIENIFPPIPSELILTVSGFLSKSSNLNIYYLIISSTIGSLLGAIILYFLGYFMNTGIITKLTNKKIFKFNKEKLNKSVENFNKHGIKTVFLARLIPVIRSLISIPAGISKMNIFIFIIFTTIGSLIWNTILILFGNLLGDNYEIILIYLDKYKTVALISLFLIILYKILTKRKKTPYNKLD